MIGEILNSKESVNVFGYDFGSTNIKDQRIKILAFEGVYINPRLKRRLNQNWNDEKSLEEFKRLGQEVARDLSYQFDAQSSQSERIKKTTGHIAISFSPADRHLLKHDAFKVILANEYRVKMGIVDTQWVLTEHLGTHAPHLHLGYNRVKFDGTVISSSHERIRSMKIAAEISEKYGLAEAGAAERRKQSLSKTQQSFHQLRDMVREALEESCSMEEFEFNLKSRGISLRMSERGDEQNSFGLSYAMIDDPTISAKGSKLDRSALSYVKVTATLDSNYAKRTEEEAQLARLQAQQEREKALELNRVYGQMAPTIQLLEKAVGSTFQLYNDTVHAGITLSAQTREKYGELTKTWDEYQHLDQERGETTTNAKQIDAIHEMMRILNPLAGLNAIVVGNLATDIRLDDIKNEKKNLLSKLEGLRTDIDNLQQKKAVMRIETHELLHEYLDAKQMLNEYSKSLDTIKQEIENIKHDQAPTENRDLILQFVQSDWANQLLAKINSELKGTNYNLVPGQLVETNTGMRWDLFITGFDNDVGTFYDEHKPAPQSYGESYIDFTKNESGHLIASIEIDPTDSKSYGLSGKVDITANKGFLKKREFCGSLKQEMIRKETVKKKYSSYKKSEEKSNQKKGHGGPHR